MPGKSKNIKIEQAELYNLDNDLGETTNVAFQHPEVIKQMMVLVELGRNTLGDSLTNRTGSSVRQAGMVSQAQK
jgi:uncharacterized protein YeaC (DUF1315 family)